MAYMINGFALGSVRVVDAKEYGDGAGYLIEEYTFANQPDPIWCIPAWDERGMSHLEGVFPTIEAAQAAIDEPA